MGRTAQTIEFSTDLGINYILCCSVVLMHYNEFALGAVADFGARNCQTTTKADARCNVELTT